MRLQVTSLLAVTLSGLGALGVSFARADDHAGFSLELSGTPYGLVRAAAPGDHKLIVDATDVAPSLVTLVDDFVQGKAVKRDVRLTSGAVVRKTEGARLLSVKLPALGSGGSADVELAFAVGSISTQPLLSTKEAPLPPGRARISAFRVDVSGMQAIEAQKLDAITITQRPDGSATTGDVTFEVGAGGAPPFVQWNKPGAAKPAPRVLRVEYVGAAGAAILKLRLERCAPSGVVPLGANGTTRITLACSSVRPD